MAWQRKDSKGDNWWVWKDCMTGQKVKPASALSACRIRLGSPETPTPTSSILGFRTCINYSIFKFGTAVEKFVITHKIMISNSWSIKKWGISTFFAKTNLTCIHRKQSVLIRNTESMCANASPSFLSAIKLHRAEGRSGITDPLIDFCHWFQLIIIDRVTCLLIHCALVSFLFIIKFLYIYKTRFEYFYLLVSAEIEIGLKHIRLSIGYQSFWNVNVNVYKNKL